MSKVEALKHIFFSGVKPSYAASSMYIECDTFSGFASHIDVKPTDEDKYWLSLCYLRYKNSSNDELNRIAREHIFSYNHEDKAKHLLLAIGG